MPFGAHSLVSTAGPRRASTFDRWCLSGLAAWLRGAAMRLQLWDGTAASASQEPAVATVVIRDRATLVGLLRQPALTFGEAYASGRLEVQGDLVALLETINRALAGRPYQRAGRPRRATRADARRNVHAHYDLGNDFYRRWLDPEMVYTCAYFEAPEQSLEDAQTAKLEYICRKLRLAPGDAVVEAGCGWGALAIYMAKHYGARVRAYNISPPQLDFARARAVQEGVADRVTFVDGDYRNVEGRCDAFVSVGMLEHVGPANYDVLGGVIDRVLDARTGRALVHFIGRNQPMPFNPWIGRYIFPGAYAPALSEVLPAIAESRRLSVTDVENLRPHYAQTLRHWLARFERCADDVRAQFDETFVRTWRLYLAGALAGFSTGDLQLFQVTLARADDDTAPWTRERLYRRPGVNAPVKAGVNAPVEE